MAFPPMLIKSNMSMQSAIFLSVSKNEDYWNYSIHCSYYAVLQMMMHLLMDVKKPPLDISTLTEGADSHNKIKDKFLLEINSPKERANFFNGFDYLKSMRVKADYKLQLFSQETCLDIMEKAEILRKKAQTFFKHG